MSITLHDVTAEPHLPRRCSPARASASAHQRRTRRQRTGHAAYRLAAAPTTAAVPPNVHCVPGHRAPGRLCSLEATAAPRRLPTWTFSNIDGDARTSSRNFDPCSPSRSSRRGRLRRGSAQLHGRRLHGARLRQVHRADRHAAWPAPTSAAGRARRPSRARARCSPSQSVTRQLHLHGQLRARPAHGDRLGRLPAAAAPSAAPVGCKVNDGGSITLTATPASNAFTPDAWSCTPALSAAADATLTIPRVTSNYSCTVSFKPAHVHGHGRPRTAGYLAQAGQGPSVCPNGKCINVPFGGSVTLSVQVPGHPGGRRTDPHALARLRHGRHQARGQREGSTSSRARSATCSPIMDCVAELRARARQVDAVHQPARGRLREHRLYGTGYCNQFLQPLHLLAWRPARCPR